MRKPKKDENIDERLGRLEYHIFHEYGPGNELLQLWDSLYVYGRIPLQEPEKSDRIGRINFINEIRDGICEILAGPNPQEKSNAE